MEKVWFRKFTNIFPIASYKKEATYESLTKGNNPLYLNSYSFLKKNNKKKLADKSTFSKKNDLITITYRNYFSKEKRSVTIESEMSVKKFYKSLLQEMIKDNNIPPEKKSIW